MKNRIGVWIIVILVVLNIMTITALWISRIRKPAFDVPYEQSYRRPPLKDFIQREISLSEDQLYQLNQIRRAHYEESREIMDEIQLKRKQMFDLLFSDNSDTVNIDKYVSEIGKLHEKLETSMIYKINELKSICTVEQQEKLQQVLNEVMHLISPREEHIRRNMHRQRWGGFEGRARRHRFEPNK